MSLDEREPRSLAGATLSLSALAVIALEAALAGDAPAPAALVGLGLELALAFIAFGWFRFRRSVEGRPPAWTGAAVLAVGLLPWVVEPLWQRFSDQGAPAEILLLRGMGYVALTLGALSCWPMFQRLAGLTSMFLVLFATSLATSNMVLPISALYVLAGSLWLMHLHWQTLHHPLGAARAKSLPRRGMLIVSGCVVAGVAFAAAAPQSAIVSLAGFLPTSGGNQTYDPDSRGGVNDGDGIVAAQRRAESVGLTDSQVSIDSKGPSLYDVFSDMYGEPYRTKKAPERSIALAPQEVLELGREPANNLRAGRDFSTVRGRRQRPKRMGDLGSRALFYVKGRTPLHLAVTAYDQFDGVVWQSAEDSGYAAGIEKSGQGAWMRVAVPNGSELPGESESYAVKLSALRTDRMPTPSRVERFRMGQVDRADFFTWQAPGVLKLADRTIPPGTVVELELRHVDWERLASVSPLALTPGGASDGAGQPKLAPEAAELAKSWTAGLPRGWPQVQAVVAAVKERCRLDRDAQVPADCRDSVSHFLFHARRGPDYQFASAVAVLLRSLGYSTRLVSGFYGSPARYDRRSRHTPITATDAHVWLQIGLSDGSWIELEPTPGYELARARLSWAARCVAAGAAAWRFVCEHAAVIGALALLCIAAFGARRFLLDAVATALWRLEFVGSFQRRVRATLRLLERRGRLAGLRRPAPHTPAVWYERLGARFAAAVRTDVRVVLAVNDWLLHAPRSQWADIPWSDDEISTSCRSLAANWTLSRLAVRGDAGAPRKRGIARLIAPFKRRQPFRRPDQERLQPEL